MDHIFGDTDDIAFGTTHHTSPSQKHQSKQTSQKVVSNSRSRDTFPKERNHPITRTRRSEENSQPTLPDIDSLTRLISSMKPSFLPKEDDMNVTRMVILSDASTQDTLNLITRDNETILIGTGFSALNRAGKSYPTFPDMRLVFSEKEHISAWVLPDDMVNIAPILTILPSIGFPPIYASRELIARFRESIHDATFLDKCRFFELFTGGSGERRIGAFEFLIGSCEQKSCLIVKTGATQIAFGLTGVHGFSSSQTGTENFLEKKDGIFLFGKEAVSSGEILSFRSGKMTKHALKFTFDTFYIDGNSVGVVAGYTLPDREQLAENGVLTFTLEEDTRARTIAGHIFIDSRGFVHSYEMMAVHKEILKGIRVTYEKLLVENPKIERGELVQSLRREITKYCYVLTGRTPVVMPIVIER